MGALIYIDFTTGWPFYAAILPFAIAQGKIFGIRSLFPPISTKETTTSRLKSMNNTKKKGERTCLGTGTNMWRC
jgi:hypothetical protein